jgi:hypothetical protein
MNAPMKAVKVMKRKVVMSTKEVARILGRAPRTVRRYAQYGSLVTVGKTARLGWQYVVLADLMVR